MALGIGVSAQANSSFTTGLTTAGVTTQASGSTFVLFLVCGPYPASQIAGVSDSLGNTYKSAPDLTIAYNTTSNAAYVWTSQGAATGGAGHTFSFTFASGLNSSAVFFVVEITSSGNYAVLDQALANNNLANATTAPAPSVTATGAGSVALGLFAGSVGGTITLTDTGGYNNILQSYLTGASNGNFVGGVSAQVGVNAGAATNDTFVCTITNAAAGTVSFKPSTATATLPVYGSARGRRRYRRGGLAMGLNLLEWF